MKALTTPTVKGRRLFVAATAFAVALTTVPATAVMASGTSSSGIDPDSLPLGSMYHVVDQIGARDMWEKGFTGQGINIALIDTGFAPVAELIGSDRIVAAVDLSTEAGVPEAEFVDNYGHGTHMAGIIAGKTPGASAKDADEHPEWFMGVAPEAGIVSVKVGDNTGGADITQVIAGVDWVVDHAAQLDIRVINLSYTSGSTLPYRTDPLTFALERAWRAGIVVVAAAGNDGRGSNGLASPANDPYLIAVGAVEAKDADKFVVPTWVSSGNGTRNPDVAAPGAHIDSLRAPLSRVDVDHPEGYVSESLFRGSGSSQAAAVVTGAAALLLDARPELRPDQVKALLQSKTVSAAPRNARFSGAGVVQVDKVYRRTAPSSVQTWPLSDGSGSIEAARGPVHLVVNGQPVVGEVNVFGAPWEGTRWTGTRWTGTRWTGTRWTTSVWSGGIWE